MSDVRARPGVLGVVGSLSSVATRQVQVALQAGVTVVRFPSPTTYTMPGETIQGWQALMHGLAVGRPGIIWTNPGEMHTASHAAGPGGLRTLADGVRELLSSTPVSGLVIVGGATAQTVFRALRASGLALAGEVAPGIPYGRLMGGPFAGLPTATKAGGFGTDTALEDCLRFLQSWTGQ
jgi:uncharacterized protein YgbK (DUF1537 family)